MNQLQNSTKRSQIHLHDQIQHAILNSLVVRKLVIFKLEGLDKYKRFFYSAIFIFLLSLQSLTAQYAKLYDFRADSNNNLSSPYYTNFVTDGTALYGMTSRGGTYDLGTIFKISRDGTGYQKLLDFDGENKGSNPLGSLLLFNDSLYGMASSGGTQDSGVIFKVNVNGGGFQKLLNFDGPNTGSYPRGSLIISNNFLYGMTNKGGTNGVGVIFKVNINGTGFDKLFDFDGAVSGANPTGSLTQSHDTLCGLTNGGGSYGKGVFFMIKTDGSEFHNYLNFDNNLSYGGSPEGSLTLYKNRLYGMTYSGGNNGCGIIFRAKVDGLFNKLTSFNTVSFGGGYPHGSLTVVGDSLCGMTEKGGVNNKGIIFKTDLGGLTLRKLMDFNATIGANPFGSLTLIDTMLYGMTKSGGIADRGVVFSINYKGKYYTKLKDFYSVLQGALPNDLITDGSFFYGITQYGGVNGKGVVYKINTDGTGYQKLLDFDGTTRGSSPQGALTLSGSVLYGVTTSGGSNGYGVIFKMHTDGSGFQKLLDFSIANYSTPHGSLVLYNDSLYGVCREGGNNGFGGIYKININGTGGLKKLHDFDGSAGSGPNGSLVLSGNYLYGTTFSGGDNNYGVIFKINKNGSGFQDLYDLDGTNGKYPYGSVVIASDSLYVTTSQGGTGDNGVVFKIKTDGTAFKKLLDFTGINGANPLGSLVLSGDSIYGTTSKGGANNVGIIFRLNVNNYGYKKIFDLDYINQGATPSGSLLFLNENYYGTCLGGTDGLGVIFKFRKTAITQATNLQFTNVLGTQMSISFTKGTGDHRAVFMCQGNNGIPTLFNGTIYAANSIFGQGFQAGTGWYCVANSDLNNITVTGLSPNTTYRVMAIEYIGEIGSQIYLNASATGNPANQATPAADQTIIFNTMPGKTYGDADFNPGATASSGLTVTYSSANTNLVSVVGNNLHIKGAGTVNITASQAGNINYHAATDITIPFTVYKADLISIADNATRKEGDANPAFTINYNGWIGADNESVLDTKPTATCLATASSPVGTYDITPFGGSDNNYNFVTYVKGTLTVQPKTGISETAEDDILVYPVPVTSQLNIKLPNTKTAILQIISLNGQVVLTKQLNNTLETIDVSGFAKGIYTIKLILKDKTIIKKI